MYKISCYTPHIFAGLLILLFKEAQLATAAKGHKFMFVCLFDGV
jgi:hypothetical protein